MSNISETRAFTAEEAIGFTIRQFLFAHRVSGVDLGAALNLSRATISRKLSGHVGWSATELLITALYFGVEVQDFMPTPDGLGNWIPAPFVPGKAKAPAAIATEANEVVAGTGFEPATSGL